MTKNFTQHNHYLFFALTVILIGLNMRPVMAGIGPILDLIKMDTAVSDTTAGLFTAVPVLAMGVFALLGGALQRLFGMQRIIVLGLIAVGLASLFRLVFHGELGLILTACVGGIGIAVVQAILPGLIKRDHSDNAGRLMTLYTAGIMGGAMLCSATVAPLSEILSWPGALSVWAIFALFALISLSLTSKGKKDKGGAASLTLPLRSARAWFLLVFFGIGTSAYTLVLAWLPPFYTQLGWSGTTAGLLLGGLTLFQVIAAIGLSSFVDRFTDRRPVLLIILATIVLGLLTLLIAPKSLALLAIVVLGLGIGALFPMSLVVTFDHMQQSSQAGALMGFVQGGGYIIASIMPFVAGMLRSEFHSLSIAWIIMIGAIIIQSLMALRLSPRHSLSPTDWTLQTVDA